MLKYSSFSSAVIAPQIASRRLFEVRSVRGDQDDCISRYSPIDRDIEDLHANEHHNVVNSDGDQDCVASVVQRLVVVSVDL